MKRHWIVTKTEGLLRLFMVNCLSAYLPLYIVTEYPKCGGSWVSQMLSEYLKIPFPRNRFPSIQSSLMQGHYLYSPFMKNVFVVLRDGRDVMVSYYYHALFINDRYNQASVEKARRKLRFKNYNNIKENLSYFIEYIFNEGKYKFTWSDFINSWYHRDVALIRYENLLKFPVDELAQAIRKVCQDDPDKIRLGEIVEKYSFKNQSNRIPGQEDKHSFLRKGIAGDWKNHFDRRACKVFYKYAGEQLIKAGYEKDNEWANGS